MDIWIAVNDTNATKAVAALSDFGMPKEALSKDVDGAREEPVSPN